MSHIEIYQINILCQINIVELSKIIFKDFSDFNQTLQISW